MDCIVYVCKLSKFVFNILIGNLLLGFVKAIHRQRHVTKLILYIKVKNSILNPIEF